MKTCISGLFCTNHFLSCLHTSVIFYISLHISSRFHLTSLSGFPVYAFLFAHSAVSSHFICCIPEFFKSAFAMNFCLVFRVKGKSEADLFPWLLHPCPIPTPVSTPSYHCHQEVCSLLFLTLCTFLLLTFGPAL